MATMRESSKRNWASDETIEQINAGSLQRIADAVERMSAGYKALEDERDRYREMWMRAVEATMKLERSNRALRGVITRLKRRVASREKQQ